MVDKKAFRSLSYGLYIVAAQHEGRRAGCVVNTFAQVTSAPPQVSVAINKENATTDVIKQAGRFTATVLSESATMELIGLFGFRSSADVDKFASCSFAVDAEGVPYVSEHCVARFSARVVECLDMGTHLLFVGEVEESEVLSDEPPMTYAYYHQVKGGKTPPKASSYEGPETNDAASAGEASAASSAEEGAVVVEDAPEASVLEAAASEAGACQTGASGGASTGRVAWRCTICGHIEYVDELPDDFTCPLCGMGKEFFEKITVE